MELSQMLTQMCRELLSDADVRAIAKNRGLSAKESASRAIFENFYLSDIGVAQAMATLTPDEVALLHLLKYAEKDSDITVLERVYTPERTTGNFYSYSTFNQRYGDALKKAQAALVRKGLLVYAEMDDPYHSKTKLERVRIRLPKEFERFLPPLLKEVRSLTGAGEVRREVSREKLQEATGRRPASYSERAGGYAVAVVEGDLRIGQQPFRAELLHQWQRACWEADAGSPPTTFTTPPADGVAPVAPVATATYALNQLEPGRWVAPEACDVALRIFCYGGRQATGQEVCLAGWQWGCLAQQIEGGKTYYRLADPTEQPQEGAPAAPATYLLVADDGAVTINLQVIPYDVLEQLAQMATIVVKEPFLIAVPNLIRLGNNLAAVREKPLAAWLHEHAPAFHQAWETIEVRWGKQIIHEGLLVARVTDPALRVQIERALSNRNWLITIADEYVAFPRGWLNEVQKAVTKAGYVVKTVNYGDKSKK